MAVVDSYIANGGKIIRVQRDRVNHGKQTVQSNTRLRPRHGLKPGEIGGVSAAVAAAVGGVALSIVYDFKGVRSAFSRAGSAAENVKPKQVWDDMLVAANASFVASEATKLKKAPAAVGKLGASGKKKTDGMIEKAKKFVSNARSKVPGVSNIKGDAAEFAAEHEGLVVAAEDAGEVASVVI
jgi:hypothetical protein